jgi:hypothetical protein
MDRRYKVTQEDVNKMRELRADGKTYREIAEVFEVSQSVPLYWCNADSRKKQRKKNAVRRRVSVSEKKKAVQQTIETRKKHFKTNPNVKLRHAIQSALDEKRCTRQSVLGIEIEEARELLKSGNLQLPNAKIE